MPEAKRPPQPAGFVPVHPDAAAVDIGATMHVAAVGQAGTPTRSGLSRPSTKTCTAGGLACPVRDQDRRDGVHRRLLDPCLRGAGASAGFEVVLVNARDAKHVPGRKTDVSDAQWLQRLHEYGLLRGSFRPQAEIAGLRAYLRQRERLLDYAAAHIQHMQKALTQMNLQLHHVVSDITGVTGMRIIRAIVGCERRPGHPGVLPRREVPCDRRDGPARRWWATTGRSTSSL